MQQGNLDQKAWGIMLPVREVDIGAHSAQTMFSLSVQKANHCHLSKLYFHKRQSSFNWCRMLYFHTKRELREIF